MLSYGSSSSSSAVVASSQTQPDVHEKQAQPAHEDSSIKQQPIASTSTSTSTWKPDVLNTPPEGSPTSGPENNFRPPHCHPSTYLRNGPIDRQKFMNEESDFFRSLILSGDAEEGRKHVDDDDDVISQGFDEDDNIPIAQLGSRTSTQAQPIPPAEEPSHEKPDQASVPDHTGSSSNKRTPSAIVPPPCLRKGRKFSNFEAYNECLRKWHREAFPSKRLPFSRRGNLKQDGYYRPYSICSEKELAGVKCDFKIICSPVLGSEGYTIEKADVVHSQACDNHVAGGARQPLLSSNMKYPPLSQSLRPRKGSREASSSKDPDLSSFSEDSGEEGSNSDSDSDNHWTPQEETPAPSQSASHVVMTAPQVGAKFPNFTAFRSSIDAWHNSTYWSSSELVYRPSIWVVACKRREQDTSLDCRFRIRLASAGTSALVIVASISAHSHRCCLVRKNNSDKKETASTSKSDVKVIKDPIITIGERFSTFEAAGEAIRAWHDARFPHNRRPAIRRNRQASGQLRPAAACNDSPKQHVNCSFSVRMLPRKAGAGFSISWVRDHSEECVSAARAGGAVAGSWRVQALLSDTEDEDEEEDTQSVAFVKRGLRSSDKDRHVGPSRSSNQARAINNKFAQTDMPSGNCVEGSSSSNASRQTGRIS